MNGSVIGYVRFWFWPFYLWSHPVSLPKNAPKVQKVILFLIWRGEERGAWLGRNWIVGWFDFFSLFFFFLYFSIWAIFTGKQGFKLEQKSKLWIRAASAKMQNDFWKIIQTFFLCWNISLVKVSAKLDHI